MKRETTIEDIVSELFRNAPEIIPRKMLAEITGGVLSVKYLANLDSEGKGIPQRMRIGGKVAYTKAAAMEFYKNRCELF